MMNPSAEKKLLVHFDVRSLYYLPQYFPVYEKLREQKHQTCFVVYKSEHDDVVKRALEQLSADFVWVDSEDDAIEYYIKHAPEWVFFGNTFSNLDRLHHKSKSAQLGHGIGPKASYYTKSRVPMTVRFVEGEYRKARLQSMFPEGRYVDVGFCKLDPIINGKIDEASCYEKFNLDPNKKTILYAPTFYPSSIELFSKKWPKEYSDFNVLIKPHYFSTSKPKYKKHRRLLEAWSKFDNVYVARDDDFSLIPFMVVSDVLVSDASSALFEFALLNKPVVWCDFLKLRWSYRGPFAYRYRRRMDQDYGEYSEIAVHAPSYKKLKPIILEQLEHPDMFQGSRQSLAEKLAGVCDGRASDKIVGFLLNN